MPQYVYSGRRRGGETVRGQLEAPSLEAAIDELGGMGIIPTDVRPGTSGGGSGIGLGIDWVALRRKLTEPRVRVDDLVVFTRQLYALTSAGVPIIRALRGLGENTRNPALSRAIISISASLEGGRSLADGMASHDRIFPPLYVAMMRVGEDSGQLEESLLRMASSLEMEQKTREQVKTALRYPTFVMIAIVLAIVVVNIFVIPAFSGIFAQLDADLPLPTRMLIATSEFFTQWWPALLVALVALVMGFRAWVRTERGQLVWDRYKLRLPVVGDIMLRALLARFARTLAMALRAGVPVLSSLSAVARTSDNAYVGGRIEGMRSGIERGESLLKTAREAALFTPLVLQMLAVGEETGGVDGMMEQVASFYEREVEADLASLSSYIEPIVIGFIGLLVLILALGIFMPMWQLGAAAM